MQKILENDYQRLKKFLVYFSEHFFNLDGLPLESKPEAILEKLENKGMKMALRGLQQAINDCIVMSRHMNPELVKKIDNELNQNNIITLSEVRKQYSQEFSKILNSGKIKNQTDYYLITGILVDTSLSIAEIERAKLEVMIDSYEKQQA